MSGVYSISVPSNPVGRSQGHTPETSIQPPFLLCLPLCTDYIVIIGPQPGDSHEDAECHPPFREERCRW